MKKMGMVALVLMMTFVLVAPMVHAQQQQTTQETQTGGWNCPRMANAAQGGWYCPVAKTAAQGGWNCPRTGGRGMGPGMKGSGMRGRGMMGKGCMMRNNQAPPASQQ